MIGDRLMIDEEVAAALAVGRPLARMLSLGTAGALRVIPSVAILTLTLPYLGLGFDKLEAPASSERLAESWGPLFEHCIEQFGPGRCMFESNFPPDKQSCGYTELWNAFKRITADASASEKTALYSGTAAKVYRLTVP